MSNEWVSVKDKLPEHDQIVLAVFDTGGSDWYVYPTNCTLLNFYKKSEFKQYFRDKSSLHEVNSEKVTHWMPLPKPPTN